MWAVAVGHPQRPTASFQAGRVPPLPIWSSAQGAGVSAVKPDVFQVFPSACRRRVFQYYLPVFFWCRRQLLQHRGSDAGASTSDGAAVGVTDGAQSPGPLVLGISAPQGCGKTTLCEELKVRVS